MGYNTDFEGSVAVSPPLNGHEMRYLCQFAATRHIDRRRGPYYVDGQHGSGDDSDVLSDDPHPSQPGRWCRWVPTADGDALEWDGAEKFYKAAEWMQYVIDHFLCLNGLAQGHPGFENFTFDHVINGSIAAQGEDPEDTWDLDVDENIVKILGLTLPEIADLRQEHRA